MTTSKAVSAKGVLALYEKGLRQLHSGEYVQARKVFIEIQEKFGEEVEMQASVVSLLRLCDRQLREVTAPSSFEELFDRGVLEHNRGNYDEAIQYYKQAFKKAKSDRDTVHRAIAAAEVWRGNTKSALENLQKAIELNEVNRFLAQGDSDFEPLFGNSDFKKLVRAQGDAD